MRFSVKSCFMAVVTVAIIMLILSHHKVIHVYNSIHVLDNPEKQREVEMRIKDGFRKHGEEKSPEVSLVKEEKPLAKDEIVPQELTEKTNPTEAPSIAKSPSAKSDDKVDKAKLPDCARTGSKLVGPVFVDQKIPEMAEVEKDLSIDFGGSVDKGGWFEPTHCKPLVKVAIIIPFRKRDEQMKLFLRHMHPILQRQELYYRIIVVDQLGDDPFNRAGLFNIGYTESLRLGNFDCFIFSDVDLLPEDDRNYYGCPTSPRHMSVSIDKFDYLLPYERLFGGTGAFTKEHFEDINGMSNLFFGWGGEDDDLYARITSKGYKLTRPSMKLGRYTMVKVKHFQSSKADPNRMNLLQNSQQRMVADGLNSLKYKLDKVDELPLVTILRVHISKSMYKL